MASNKVKFKMTIKEVAFEFEGDYEQGRQLQQGINNTMQGLANLQNRAMGLPDPAPNGQPKMIESRVVDPVRRRKRKRAIALNLNEGEAGAPERAELFENQTGGGADENGEGGGSAPRRSTGVSPTALLVGLRKSGFFAAKQGMGAIVAKLHTDGYPMIRSSDISPILSSLCRKQVLKRERNESGKWVYERGPNEE